MPGQRNNKDTLSTEAHHGLQTTMEVLIPAKDITKIQSSRKLNEYITIPRRTRTHPRNPQDYVLTIIQPNSQPRLIEPTPDETPKTVDTPDDSRLKPDVGDSQTEKRERTWSFKKIKQILGRSKSLKSKESDNTESGSNQEKTSETLETPAGVLFSSSPCTRKEKNVPRQIKPHAPIKSDIYADIESVKSRFQSRTLKDKSDTSSCNTGSSTSMSGSEHRHRVSTASCPEKETGNKSAVLKVLSSLSIRNLTARRKTGKKLKPSIMVEPSIMVDNVDYSCEFARDPYRGSFKEPAHPTYGNECKRSKSFSAQGQEYNSDLPSECDMDPNGIYSKQTQYEIDDKVVYSLARSDTPPPLPERTYLKLRKEALKENTNPVEYLSPPQYGYDATGKCVSYETNNNCLPLGTSNSVYGQTSVNQTGTYHMSKRQNESLMNFPNASGYAGAKPFMIHQHLKLEHDQHTVSSGYSSVTSETPSMDSDYFHTPVTSPTCKLPKRSKHLQSRGPSLPLRNTPNTAHYSNQETEQKRQVWSDSSHGVENSEVALPSRKEESQGISDCTLTRNKVHNLPLLPEQLQSQAQLVRTINLGCILKSKWISGIAVTKKNEYIVVDQREAYLLDEEGTLKKTIGSKGSNKLIEPMNVTVMPSNGNLVICDHAEQDCKVFSWRGQYLRRVRDPALTNIAGIAATEDRNIVIAGTDKQRVSIISEENKLLYTIPAEKQEKQSSPFKNKSPFEHPYSIAVNPLTGDIIIGDDYKQVVTAVAPSKDGKNARILWRYCPRSGERHFFPSAICADSNGYIFIADLYNEKIYMLDSGGKFVKTLLSRGDGLKGGPGAIAADCNGHLLVADEEKTLKVFRYGDDKGFAVNKRYSYCPKAT